MASERNRWTYWKKRLIKWKATIDVESWKRNDGNVRWTMKEEMDAKEESWWTVDEQKPPPLPPYFLLKISKIRIGSVWWKKSWRR